MPIIGGTGCIENILGGGNARGVGVGEKVACASVGQIKRAATIARVSAGDTLDAASVGGRGTGGDRPTELEIDLKSFPPAVVDGIVAVFDRGN